MALGSELDIQKRSSLTLKLVQQSWNFEYVGLYLILGNISIFDDSMVL